MEKIKGASINTFFAGISFADYLLCCRSDEVFAPMGDSNLR